jgi:tellurite resistance protein
VDPHAIGSTWSLLEHWDFTVETSQEALLEFFKALIVCCNGDGKLTDDEREWCVGYCAAIGGTEETLLALRDYPGDESVAEVIARGRPHAATHRRLIYDAIRAASSDGEYHQDERATVRRMAAEVGVPEADVDAFEALCLEEQRLKDRRLSLVIPVGTPH